ncbi:MAG: hypothetical protein ACO4AJ_06690, partial [Prochlorothrix sp.]
MIDLLRVTARSPESEYGNRRIASDPVEVWLFPVGKGQPSGHLPVVIAAVTLAKGQLMYWSWLDVRPDPTPDSFRPDFFRAPRLIVAGGEAA